MPMKMCSSRVELGNDTGQPNPTGSWVRVSLGSGVGQGESTRDPGPTHLKTYLKKENKHSQKISRKLTNI